jgi:hypothetical protein
VEVKAVLCIDYINQKLTPVSRPIQNISLFQFVNVKTIFLVASLARVQPTWNDISWHKK